MKKKLWKKLLPLSTMLAITVGVPIVATACSTSEANLGGGDQTAKPSTKETELKTYLEEKIGSKISETTAKQAAGKLDQEKNNIKSDLKKYFNDAPQTADNLEISFKESNNDVVVEISNVATNKLTTKLTGFKNDDLTPLLEM